MQYRLADIAQEFDVTIEGDETLIITGLCGLSDDKPDCLSFISRRKHVPAAAASKIAAFVTTPELKVAGKTNLYHAAPEHLMAQIAHKFLPAEAGAPGGIHDSAVVAASADVGDGVSIGANAVIGEHVAIGARTRIFANVVVLDRSVLGEDCVIYPNTTIREDSRLGNRVILQPGVTIGGDGFGYVNVDGEHVKIPQLGHVVLEDDVEIGANSTVDRGRFTETRIGRGTKVDNLVMLAHNVATGAHCLIISQTGVSGSTKLGDRVTLAGQVGTVGHVNVTDDVTVLGKGGITKDINKPGVYAGMPLKPAKLWRKAMARLYAGLR